jgi:hypothetical protein
MNAIWGAILIVISLALLWVMMPKEGRVHPLATKPGLDSAIPLTIVGSGIAGIGFIFLAVLEWIK